MNLRREFLFGHAECGVRGFSEISKREVGSWMGLEIRRNMVGVRQRNVFGAKNKMSSGCTLVRLVEVAVFAGRGGHSRELARAEEVRMWRQERKRQLF